MPRGWHRSVNPLKLLWKGLFGWPETLVFFCVDPESDALHFWQLYRSRQPQPWHLIYRQRHKRLFWCFCRHTAVTEVLEVQDPSLVSLVWEVLGSRRIWLCRKQSMQVSRQSGRFSVHLVLMITELPLPESLPCVGQGTGCFLDNTPR